MSKKLFIDTNIWLRFLVKDESEQHQASAKLIEQIEQGVYQPYTSSWVMMELFFVLTKLYAHQPLPAQTIIKQILTTRSLTLIEKTSLSAAISLSQQTKVKLADCLIATQIPTGIMLVTYDHDFTKLAKHLTNLQIQTPETLVGK